MRPVGARGCRRPSLLPPAPQVPRSRTCGATQEREPQSENPLDVATALAGGYGGNSVRKLDPPLNEEVRAMKRRIAHTLTGLITILCSALRRLFEAVYPLQFTMRGSGGSDAFPVGGRDRPLRRLEDSNDLNTHSINAHVKSFVKIFISWYVGRYSTVRPHISSIYANCVRNTKFFYIFRGETLDILFGMPHLPIRALSCRLRMVIDTDLNTGGA